MIERAPFFAHIPIESKWRFLKHYFAWQSHNAFMGSTDFDHRDYRSLMSMGEELIPLALRMMHIDHSTALIPAVLDIMKERVISPGASPTERRDELVRWGIINGVI